jgi:hypothetical protein
LPPCPRAKLWQAIQSCGKAAGDLFHVKRVTCRGGYASCGKRLRMWSTLRNGSVWVPTLRAGSRVVCTVASSLGAVAAGGLCVRTGTGSITGTGPQGTHPVWLLAVHSCEGSAGLELGMGSNAQSSHGGGVATPLLDLICFWPGSWLGVRVFLDTSLSMALAVRSCEGSAGLELGMGS